MDSSFIAPCTQDRAFLGAHHSTHERRTWSVVVLTAVMMAAEIIGGTLFGSIALIADGWHMATHVAALAIAGLAYLFARRHANDARFSLGTGKFGDLAAFASAIILGLIALGVGYESILRLTAPRRDSFSGRHSDRRARICRQPRQRLAVARRSRSRITAMITAMATTITAMRIATTTPICARLTFTCSPTR